LGFKAKAQIGYIVPLISMMQLKSEINEALLPRKLTMLHVTYNKQLQQITLQSGLCRGNPSTQKISQE